MVFNLYVAIIFKLDLFNIPLINITKNVLLCLRKLGFKIAEVPINWTNIPGSKVVVLRDSCVMLLDLLHLRWLSLIGAYDKCEQR